MNGKSVIIIYRFWSTPFSAQLLGLATLADLGLRNGPQLFFLSSQGLIFGCEQVTGGGG